MAFIRFPMSKALLFLATVISFIELPQGGLAAVINFDDAADGASSKLITAANPP